MSAIAASTLLLLSGLLACGDKDESKLIIDDDGDGYTIDDDCNDDDPSIRPGAVEYCDGIDQDCNGVIDDDPTDGTVYHRDEDGDGYGHPSVISQECEQPPGYVLDSTDCDDLDDAIYPGAPELCNDEDDDCDDEVDEDATDADAWYADVDEDGYGDAGTGMLACERPSGMVADDTDCDDTDAEVHPGAEEYCDDTDRDCDGDPDNDALDGTTYYTDADNDDWGDESTAVILCTGGGSLVETPGDCDDADGSVYPDAPEVCGDGQVNACGGTPDDAALVCGGWGDPVTDADATATAAGASSLGASLAVAGEVILLGAPFGGTDGRGQVYVVDADPLGADLLSGAARIDGASADEGLGAEVAGIADIDGDRVADLLLAGTAEGDLGQGIVYLLSGGERTTDLAADALATWTGESTGDLAGAEALVGAGDLTGDGRPDFVVGARYGSLGGTLAGQAYVVSGAATGSHGLDEASARLYATGAYGFAMARVLAPGDLDGDGVEDVVVEGTGDLAWVALGPLSGDVDLQADADVSLGGATGDLSDLDALDVDGDGVLDLVLSVASDSTEATYAGAAWLHTGGWASAEVDLTGATLVIHGTTASGFLGGELALVDDLDGDEQADLVLGTGASTVEDDGLDAFGGAATVRVYGEVGSLSGSLTDADASLTFTSSHADFGMDLSSLGDIDGDGRADLLIAAPESGMAWLFLADRRY